MTSSLVGSEMCIRDRPSARHPGRVSYWKDYGHRIAWKHHPASDPWPVSYTHLTLPTICSV
eukprot:6595948-Prorocentrum_lima.AAC.1